ncbi:MAG: glycosyltransferase family 4 protein, partial [Pseudomonadota bacterium]
SVWGTPEVVAVPEAGRLIPERSAGAIAQTVAALLNDLPDRAATRAYAEQFSWVETTQKQLKIFQQICAEAADGAPALAQS